MMSVAILIDTILNIFFWCIILSAILSWLIAFEVINTQNRFVFHLYDFLNRITNPFLKPIRRIVPSIGGVDISPVILLLAIIFIQNLLAEYVFKAMG